RRAYFWLWRDGLNSGKTRWHERPEFSQTRYYVGHGGAVFFADFVAAAVVTANADHGAMGWQRHVDALGHVRDAIAQCGES
ncbi:MAG TPA: hypothetical protein PLI12_01715, partial [Acetobacteraceae bacterium]|nr:hypothetical protein [Acetobacteraceae bacterium]